MVTQLLHNYRSLPSVLATYSKLSYESKLIANISDEDSEEIRLLERFQTMDAPSVKLNHSPKYGVYFMGILANEIRPSNSTSWKNPREALEVCNFSF